MIALLIKKILYFLGEGEVGIYGIGGRVITLVNVIASGVSMAYTTFAYYNVDNPDAKEQYASAYEPMRDMMFAQVIYAISTITSYGIYFKKKSGYALISTTVAAVST